MKSINTSFSTMECSATSHSHNLEILRTQAMASRFNRMLILAAFLMLAMMASQATCRNLNEASMNEKHEQWMAQYGRVYKDDVEKAKRYKIFKENLEFIESFNKAGNRPYKLGINEFADITNEEFRTARNGYIPWKVSESKSFVYENVSTVPSTVDWRKRGAVTPVKDQGQCGKSNKAVILYTVIY